MLKCCVLVMRPSNINRVSSPITLLFMIRIYSVGLSCFAIALSIDNPKHWRCSCGVSTARVQTSKNLWLPLNTSTHIHTHPNASEHVRTYPKTPEGFQKPWNDRKSRKTSESVQTRPNTSENIRKRLNTSQHVRTRPKTFGNSRKLQNVRNFWKQNVMSIGMCD